MEPSTSQGNDHTNFVREASVFISAENPSETAPEATDSSTFERLETVNDEDHRPPGPLADFRYPSCAVEKEETQEHVDSATCSICMEPWTGEGAHRICCISCGHLFGRSCIRRWLRESGKRNSKCPHCGRKARIEDIRNLYVPSVTVVESGSQQLHEELKLLKKRNEELVAQNIKLNKEVEILQGLLGGDQHLELRKLVHGQYTPQEHVISSLYARTGCLEWSLGESLTTEGQRRAHRKRDYREQGTIESEISYQNAHIYQTDRILSRESHCFQLQEEFSMAGAKVFDMDAFSQMILIAQKSSDRNFCLNKISLLSLSDKMIMPLPEATGSVRDICIAPPDGRHPGRLALVASLGKRISLFSLESNNIVLAYTIPSPCWSCAWDPLENNRVLAGCQDGSIVVFDLRQTSSPVRTYQGIYRQPVHTLHPLDEFHASHADRRTGFLSACSSGVCSWDMKIANAVEDCRPCPIPYVGSERVCVALAYNHLADVAVSTFRPKPCVAGEMLSAANTGSNVLSSQLSLQQSPESYVVAAHAPLSRIASNNHAINIDAHANANNNNNGWQYGTPMMGHVSTIGMRRSAIVCRTRKDSSIMESMFAFGDDETRAIHLWDVNTKNVIDRLRSHASPVLDVKSMNNGPYSILVCISASTLQVYKG